MKNLEPADINVWFSSNHAYFHFDLILKNRNLDSYYDLPYENTEESIEDWRDSCRYENEIVEKFGKIISCCDIKELIPDEFCESFENHYELQGIGFAQAVKKLKGLGFQFNPLFTEVQIKEYQLFVENLNKK